MFAILIALAVAQYGYLCGVIGGSILGTLAKIVTMGA